MVRPERFELPTLWFVAKYSIQLSYGRTSTSSIRNLRQIIRVRPQPQSLPSGCGRWLGRRRRRNQRQFFGYLQARQPHQLRHRRRIQPRRIVLNPQCALFLVDADPANPINVARACQRKGHALSRRRGVAIEYLYRGHKQMITSPGILPLTSSADPTTAPSEMRESPGSPSPARPQTCCGSRPCGRSRTSPATYPCGTAWPPTPTDRVP